MSRRVENFQNGLIPGGRLTVSPIGTARHVAVTQEFAAGIAQTGRLDAVGGLGVSGFHVRKRVPVDQPRTYAGSCRTTASLSGFTRVGFAADAVAAAAGNLPGAHIPVALTRMALTIEAELRGAAGWWILFGQRLGVGEQELAAVSGARLQVATVAGLARSVSLGRVFKVAGVVAFVFLVLIPLLGALLLG